VIAEKSLQIIYEDNHLIAINKRPSDIVQGDKTGDEPLSDTVKAYLKEKYNNVTYLDGDVVRQNLSSGLGFSKEDRSKNIRRIGYVASEVVKHDGIVVCANIAPYEEDRQYNRKIISKNGRYIEIYVKTSWKNC